MPKKLAKEIKNINRLRQILVVLFENGFSYFIDKIGGQIEKTTEQ